MFNADDFMNTTVEGPLSTVSLQVPIGEYTAVIGTDEGDIQLKSGQGKKDPTKTWVQATVLWTIKDQTVLDFMKREVVKVRQQFFLDLDDNGGIDRSEGRNVTLGQLRAALGMNAGSFSFNQLRGAGPATVKVVHTPDQNDPEKKYAEVSRVVPLK